MKTPNYKKFFSMLMLILCLFIYSSGYAHAEVSYIGEFCVWAINSSEINPFPFLFMKLGALKYGDDHYVLDGNAGTIFLPDIQPVHGTGALDNTGNNFVATLVSSLVDTTNTNFAVCHLALNLETGSPRRIGNGTMTEMKFDFTLPAAQSTVTTIPVWVTNDCSP